MPFFQPHTIAESATLKQALEKINSLGGAGTTLFVLDAEGKPSGTLTDGDVRRALLRGLVLNVEVSAAMRSDFVVLTPESDSSKVLEEARKRGVRSLPKVDAAGKLVAVIDLDSTTAILPIDAVLMAGGKGERLRPLTFSVPKPLLKVGEKAIIDYNIDALTRCGVDSIFVTVNYLHEQIEEHFASPRHGVMVKCVREPRALGTIGSLALVNGLTHDNVLVMNSDLLTTIDFVEMLERHISSGADMTMATVPYTVSVPYAIIRSQGDRVTALEEKPTYNYFANAGVYLLRRELIAEIPRGARVDAPDFMESLIASGRKVSWYPLRGTWIDIGSPQDYQAACTLMASGR